MTKGRLEAFSDGVIAILITIMVIELHAPPGDDVAALGPVVPVLLSFVMSFIYLAIYWNNHHHMLHAVKRINGAVLWANMHLLFWLSLVPFVTAWTGHSHFAAIPVAAYGCVLFAAGVAYFVLSRALITAHPENATLALAVGRDAKGIASVVLYAIAVAVALVAPLVASGIYVLVAIIWLIPDRRIERALEAAPGA
jgi:uncharacterized membrane protein